MYLEIFLIILIISVTYFIYYGNDSRIEIEGYNNKKYKVRPDINQDLLKRKADFLAELDVKAQTITKEMFDDNYPNEVIANRLYTRFKNSSIDETPPNDNGAAYTINKGPISICIQKKNGEFHNSEDAFFVILHELAHIMSNSYGHGKEFQDNFDYIIKYAVKKGHWKDKEYETKPTDYCGVNITSSPCDNDACSKNSLDKYFKETLF